MKGRLGDLDLDVARLHLDPDAIIVVTITEQFDAHIGDAIVLQLRQGTLFVPRERPGGGTKTVLRGLERFREIFPEPRRVIVMSNGTKLEVLEHSEAPS